MMDGDIFSRAGNRRRVYALAGFTVQYRVQGWYYRRTDHDEPYKGPYGTETSVTLMMLARSQGTEKARRLAVLNLPR